MKKIIIILVVFSLSSCLGINKKQEIVEQIKKAEKEGLSEDAAKDGEAGIQEVTNEYIDLIEKHLAAKEKEIMSV